MNVMVGHSMEDSVGVSVDVASDAVNREDVRKGRQRWSNRWKGAMNAFDTEFDGRLTQQH